MLGFTKTRGRSRRSPTRASKDNLRAVVLPVPEPKPGSSYCCSCTKPYTPMTWADRVLQAVPMHASYCTGVRTLRHCVHSFFACKALYNMRTQHRLKCEDSHMSVTWSARAYAAGCVLYACLAGVHPFPMDSLLANIQVSDAGSSQTPDPP